MSGPFGLSIFSAPKPLTDPHIRRIQLNAIRSWLKLGAEVQVLLVGDEPGLAEAAQELEVEFVREVRRNRHGTPLVSDIFEQARKRSTHPVLGYVNADIILLPDALPVLQAVQIAATEYLAIGRRWDLAVNQELEFGDGWSDELKDELARAGRQHPAGGSDYFFFSRDSRLDIPDFAIGRAGWDNWMIYAARRNGWATVDLSGSLTAVHQDHDYRHLPGAQPHYRLPESQENVRLAGGRRRLFTLADADHVLQAGQLGRPPRRLSTVIRSLETAAVLRTRSKLLAELAFALAHPIAAAREWLGRLRYVVRSRLGPDRRGRLARE